MVERPVDKNLIGKFIMKTEEVRIQDLLNEKVEEEKLLSRCHLFLQILSEQQDAMDKWRVVTERRL